MTYPYSPVYSVDELEKIFSKMYKAPYNKFFWYRLYVPKNSPLDNRVDLERRVKNGDFDFSHFFYQAAYVEHKLNKAYERLYPDFARYVDEYAVDIRRREKLMEAFRKDEDGKLERLLKECSIRYKQPKEVIEKEMEVFEGDVKELINTLNKKFK